MTSNILVYQWLLFLKEITHLCFFGDVYGMPAAFFFTIFFWFLLLFSPITHRRLADKNISGIAFACSFFWHLGMLFRCGDIKLIRDALNETIFKCVIIILLLAHLSNIKGYFNLSFSIPLQKHIRDII